MILAIKDARLYHWINGVWSNIPLCCIRHWHAGGRAYSNNDPHSSEVEYVRCPKCIAASRYNKIRKNGRICAFLVDF